MKPDEESNYTPEEKATYSKIKEYVKNKYGVNVHTSYIAQVKRMCGLDTCENYNKSKQLFNLAHDDISKQQAIIDRKKSLEELLGHKFSDRDDEYLSLYALQTA